MADMLADAADWIADQLSGHISQTVTYRRGGLSVELAATKSEGIPEALVELGRVDYEPCDWIIKASLLVLGGATVEPQKNDVIEEADGAKWQVLPLDSEKPFRRWHSGAAYRIHTKRTKAAD